MLAYSRPNCFIYCIHVYEYVLITLFPCSAEQLEGGGGDDTKRVDTLCG